VVYHDHPAPALLTEGAGEVRLDLVPLVATDRDRLGLYGIGQVTSSCV
jgi:hypothetical protein